MFGSGLGQSEAIEGTCGFFPSHNHSNLRHPSPLVIPTRISYFALLATTTCAALREESRMQIIKATGLHRKSGGAQWRDLCVETLSWKCLDKFFFDVISKVRAQCLR